MRAFTFLGVRGLPRRKKYQMRDRGLCPIFKSDHHDQRIFRLRPKRNRPKIFWWLDTLLNMRPIIPFFSNFVSCHTVEPPPAKLTHEENMAGHKALLVGQVIAEKSDLTLSYISWVAREPRNWLSQLCDFWVWLISHNPYYAADIHTCVCAAVHRSTGNLQTTNHWQQNQRNRAQPLLRSWYHTTTTTQLREEGRQHSPPNQRAIFLVGIKKKNLILSPADTFTSMCIIADTFISMCIIADTFTRSPPKKYITHSTQNVSHTPLYHTPHTSCIPHAML